MRHDLKHVVAQTRRNYLYRGKKSPFRKYKHFKLDHNMDCPDETFVTIVPGRTLDGYDRYNYNKFRKIVFQANIGRRWDDVYSEIRNLLVGYKSNKTLIQYVKLVIETIVFESNGSYFDAYGNDITTDQYSYYIDPITGILQKGSKQKKRSCAS